VIDSAGLALPYGLGRRDRRGERVEAGRKPVIFLKNENTDLNELYGSVKQLGAPLSFVLSFFFYYLSTLPPLFVSAFFDFFQSDPSVNFFLPGMCVKPFCFL